MRLVSNFLDSQDEEKEESSMIEDAVVDDEEEEEEEEDDHDDDDNTDAIIRRGKGRPPLLQQEIVEKIMDHHKDIANRRLTLYIKKFHDDTIYAYDYKCINFDRKVIEYLYTHECKEYIPRKFRFPSVHFLKF
jgi:hypothetical protein